MPAFIAAATGAVNEVESVSVVAMPAALADTAALICWVICEAIEQLRRGVRAAVVDEHQLEGEVRDGGAGARVAHW